VTGELARGANTTFDGHDALEVTPMPYTTNHGTRIHFEVEGQGPPLVIHHGFTDSMATWYELGYVEMLKQDYRLILVDARGHGDSEKPHDPDAYDTTVMVSDVVAVLDAAHAPRAHFLGYSMGGGIAFGMAKYARERLLSLLIGGSHPYKRPPELYDQLLSALQRGTEAILEHWDAQVPPTLRERLLRNDIKACMALTRKRRESPSFEEVLPTMTMPCLLYAGDADKVYAAVKQCSVLIPRATFVSFPGLNHVATLFHVELVVSEIRKFLALESGAIA
jgi:pimeloyl-ACP methyl ester carboxylesterase